jgi:hypothetical protein
MALKKSFPKNCRGVTILELLIAGILTSLVLGASAAIYASGARFLGTVRQSVANSQPPTLQPIIKRIDLGNFARVSENGSQLDVRCDCDPVTLLPQADGPGVNDTWFHFKIIQGSQNTTVRWTIDQNENSAVSADDTILYDNVNRRDSSFGMVSSGQGTDTVVETNLMFTSPVVTLNTQTALSGATKQ